ncbi:MAG: hypothetical protein D6743_10665 [Calditrichaeota bacterium]|nr:MAG: hypothetical protein D6743_10665 [Calditrichota bacterium]
MSGFQGLILNGRHLSRSWLLENRPFLDADAFTENELMTLRFCSDWLAGAQTFVLQTSGSTGAPRSVRLTRAQMVASAEATGRALGLKPGDRALVCLSPAYIAGLMMLVRGFVLGLELVVVEPRGNPLLQLDSPETCRLDFAAFVPLQVQKILAAGGDTLAMLHRMKAILVGGAPISQELHRKLQQVQAPIYQTFGMTETVSHIALRRLNGAQAGDFYEALPGVCIDTDERGCLKVKAPQTAQKWVVTNDLVELLSSARFRWRGRFDNVINSGGVKLAAEQLEEEIAAVLAREDVTSAIAGRPFFVCGLPDAALGEAVTLVFEGEPFSRTAQQELLALLRARLPRYHGPASIRFLPHFARTANGKLQRRTSRERLLSKRRSPP